MSEEKPIPRAYTKEEMTDMFLQSVRSIANCWAQYPDKTPEERCNGVAFSILATIDGTSIALPAFNLTPVPHPDDKQYHIDEGSNYWPDDVAFNAETYLHDLFYQDLSD